MKSPDHTFLTTLLSENYRRNWKSEQHFQTGKPAEFAAALVDLRERTGLTKSQFALACPGSILALSNIRNLELKGRPVTADLCEALLQLSNEYGFANHAFFFRRLKLNLSHGTGAKKGGRPRLSESRYGW